MKTTEPTNPYSPDSQSLALASVGQAVRVRTWIGLVLGILLLAGDLLVAIRIPYLYTRYPGLNDRSTGPVYYWPSLEVEISTIVLTVTLPVCFAILIPSINSFRRQRTSPKDDV
jgi:hypothetical protein